LCYLWSASNGKDQGSINLLLNFCLGEDGICDLFRYSQEDSDSLEELIESNSTRVVIPVNENWDTIVVDAWKARSVYIESHENGEKDYWHVHPELVENILDDANDVSTVKHQIKMCPCCFENAMKGKLSKYSIANGVDFGDYRRVGLSPLNLHCWHWFQYQRVCYGQGTQEGRRP